MVRLLALVALVGAVCSACLGGSGGAAPAAHVAGRVVVDACCGPAGTAGVRTEDHILPVPGVLVAITERTKGARLTRLVRADATGRFDVRLAEGCYTVVARIRPSAMPALGVCVHAGETTRVAVAEHDALD